MSTETTAHQAPEGVIGAEASTLIDRAPATDVLRIAGVTRPWIGQPSSLVVLLIALLIGIRVAVIGLAVVSPADVGPTAAFWADAGRYHEIATHAGQPYRDFEVEYPPVTLGFIEAINGANRKATANDLAIVSLLLDISVAAALLWGWGRSAAIAYLMLGLPLLVLPFVYFRIDLLSVALALWGLALVRRERQVTGGVLLALAIFAKLWPLALVPWLILQRKWTALATTMAVGTIGGAFWLAWSGTNGITQVITFRHAHGWQIESLIGGIYRLAIDQPARIESGAVRVGNSPYWASAVLGLVVVALVSWTWLRAARTHSRSTHRVDGLVPLAAICIVLLCSPLLSPQYLVWILPFAAIAWKPHGTASTTLTAIATLLTVLLAAGYVDLSNGTIAAEFLLIARNLALIAIVVVVMRETRARVPQRGSREDSRLPELATPTTNHGPAVSRVPTRPTHPPVALARSEFTIEDLDGLLPPT